MRPATDADVEQIVALQVARNGAEWEAQVRALLAHPEVGPGCFTVAADGDRVVSSLCLLSARFRLDHVEVPVGQPEFVATLTSHEHRGLVRAQMDVRHRHDGAGFGLRVADLMETLFPRLEVDVTLVQ